MRADECVRRHAFRLGADKSSWRPMNYSSKVDEYNKQVHGIEKKDYSELVDRLVSLK